ncbi:MAG: dephospho-CoA kinase [Candidatus Thioglobus sp.]|nr:MAG: dephospho-CoA kinase [Candidatus Thioglobus sp.]KAA0456939.1 MAG: dephospho-CoA kinase [Candidatus Thioglobus sp.]
MKTLKIALTGGIACGKSAFAGFLAELGAQIIYLDDLSKQVSKPNSEALLQLVDAFGTRILAADGSLNRQILRTILLENADDKMLIENILQTKILQKMQKLIEKSQKPMIIVEIPLLFEKKLDYLFDRAIIITCNPEKQLKRLQKRPNISKNSAKQLISAQISPENRLKAATQIDNDIIENNADIENLASSAKQIYQKLINL